MTGRLDVIKKHRQGCLNKCPRPGNHIIKRGARAIVPIQKNQGAKKNQIKKRDAKANTKQKAGNKINNS